MRADMLHHSLVPETEDKDCISTCGGDTAKLKPSWSHGSHARQSRRSVSVDSTLGSSGWIVVLDCRMQNAESALANQNTRTTYCSPDNNINLATKEPNVNFQNIKGQRPKNIATNIKKNKETTQETKLDVRRTLSWV